MKSNTSGGLCRERCLATRQNETQYQKREKKEHNCSFFVLMAKNKSFF